MDSRILAKGQHYKNLKNVLIIFIVPYDTFGENRMMYTPSKACFYWCFAGKCDKILKESIRFRADKKTAYPKDKLL